MGLVRLTGSAGSVGYGAHRLASVCEDLSGLESLQAERVASEVRGLGFRV